MAKAKNADEAEAAAASPRLPAGRHGLPREFIVQNQRERIITALVDTARAGKCTPADLRGGTISVTNVGVFGVDSGTPILNPGETAILCVGQIAERPWVHKGKLAVRSVCPLSVSFDHRVLDGEGGSKFLADVGAFLSDPARTALAWA